MRRKSNELKWLTSILLYRHVNRSSIPLTLKIGCLITDWFLNAKRFRLYHHSHFNLDRYQFLSSHKYFILDSETKSQLVLKPSTMTQLLGGNWYYLQPKFLQELKISPKLLQYKQFDTFRIYPGMFHLVLFPVVSQVKNLLTLTKVKGLFVKRVFFRSALTSQVVCFKQKHFVRLTIPLPFQLTFQKLCSGFYHTISLFIFQRFFWLLNNVSLANIT